MQIRRKFFSSATLPGHAASMAIPCISDSISKRHTRPSKLPCVAEQRSAQPILSQYILSPNVEIENYSAVYKTIKQIPGNTRTIRKAGAGRNGHENDDK